MEQMVIHGVAPFLPEEIMTNILKRLPVKSVMRFQCVCKHWKNLFKTPSFITDNLRHSTHHNPSFMFFLAFSLDYLQLHFVDCKMQVCDVQKTPPLDSLLARLVRIVGSSNGLLCVAISESGFYRSPTSVFLWNPATREVREVPRSKTIDYSVYSWCELGFGFSSFVNDYKIVAISRLITGVGVYSLSRDSWKEIEFGNFLKGIAFISDGTVVSFNGAIFWDGFKRTENVRREVIISFDIATEDFTLIPWPTLKRTQNSYTNVIVYKDKLGLLVSEIGVSPNFELWVMEEEIGSSRERWIGLRNSPAALIL